jgi:hypothetical protein
MRTKTVSAIFAVVIFVILIGKVSVHSAEINVNVGIGVPLPHVVIHEPPPVVVIPGTYVYFAPNVGVNIFFYHGYWYRPHDGRWYRANGYNGPWHKVRKRRVPHVVRELPPDFRHRVRHQEQIHYRDLNKNWQVWERDRHWDRRDRGHEVQNVRDDKRWERTASQEDGKEKKNDSGRGGKGKNKR